MKNEDNQKQKVSPTLDIINLVPQERFKEEPVSKFLSWAESAGKVIVVLTEALVLMVFFARFRIDAQILDLKQEMTAKAQLLQSLSGFEQEFKDLQASLQNFEALSAKLYSPDPVLSLIEKNIPQDVSLQSLQISPQKVVLLGISSSYNSVSIFWQNLKKELPQDGEVSLTNLGRQASEVGEKEGESPMISFTIEIKSQELTNQEISKTIR